VSDSINERDDLIRLTERLEAGLISRVTNRRDEIQDDEYRRTRRVLLNHPNLADVIPDFIRECRSTDQIWGYISSCAEIQSGQGVWQARRSFIRGELGRVIDRLESENIDLVGDYEQVRLLGQGGFGQVYEYRHRSTRESNAIKFFNPAFSEGGEPGFLERFMRESRILQRLRHPNIITVHASGQHGRRPYIRMEYFSGRDLGAHLQRHGVFEPTLALRVIRALVAGLAHAHEMGIVHRDLKPSNIMTAKPDQLRIIDFGLGAFVEQELVSRITRTGQAMVGGHYTAPELVANPRLLDPRSDLYSVGAVWYELVLGRPPAGSRVSETLLNSQLPRAQADIMLRCLADLSDRFPHCAALIAALDNV